MAPPESADLGWPNAAADNADAIMRDCAMLQLNIKKNHARQQLAQQALERENEELRDRLTKLDQQHEKLKSEIRVISGLSGLPVATIESHAKVNTKSLPCSPATFETQQASLSFRTYEELVRMYHIERIENNRLRRNVDEMNRVFALMKARVKEWREWASKGSTKRSDENNRTRATAKLDKDHDARMDRRLSVNDTSRQSEIRHATNLCHNMHIRGDILRQASYFLGYLEGGAKTAPDNSNSPQMTLFKDHVPEETMSTCHIAEPLKVPAEPNAGVETDREQSLSRRAPQRLSHSRTTWHVDDGLESMHNAIMSNDDVHVVSERRLKRKLSAGVDVHRDPPGSGSCRDIRIKVEPPDIQSTLRVPPTTLIGADTLDLDDIGMELKIPRKRRCSRNVSEGSRLGGNSPCEARSIDRPTNTCKKDALQPRDVNIQSRGRLDVAPAHASGADQEKRKAKVIPVELSDKPSPATVPELCGRSMRRCHNPQNAATSTPKEASELASPPAPVCPKISTPQTESRAPDTGRTRRGKHDKARPVPLRTKPLSALHLSDFKINPKTNGGYTVPYVEVVRGREARRHLPGCTRLECCGRALRALVDAAEGPDTPKCIPEHCGSRDGVNTPSPAVLKELAMQEKMKALANRFGCHKHAHRRARTPPGFWRTDFPGTQEREADLEEARKNEREDVKERWVEAMKEGGRWLFRDE